MVFYALISNGLSDWSTLLSRVRLIPCQCVRTALPSVPAFENESLNGCLATDEIEFNIDAISCSQNPTLSAVLSTSVIQSLFFLHHS